jgi:hypothetical protein
MDGISPSFFAELLCLIHLLTLEESEKSGITQMRLNLAKPMPDKSHLLYVIEKHQLEGTTISTE